MAKLGLAITEAILVEYGCKSFLQKLSDPFWFQSFGAVMGMDWHSSGITTSVMGALKRAINPYSKELGLYFCGGKGTQSRKTPEELLIVANLTGLNGDELVRSSKLSAKVDNTAIQDGFQLYLHNFVLSREGDWSVIQQGMNDLTGTARRYHWHSASLSSFVNEPHTAICGENQGQILNLVSPEASDARRGIISIVHEEPNKILQQTRHLMMPSHHDLRPKDIDLKRLGSILWLAQEKNPGKFEDLLLLEGVGPRTLQSLTLVSEVIHGTASRFSDPARFSFAHGGKDGHPFPVPTKVYDETINILRSAVDKAKLGQTDKNEAIKKLTAIAQRAEKDFNPSGDFDELIKKERENSWKYGGKTVFGEEKPQSRKNKSVQLRMF